MTNINETAMKANAFASTFYFFSTPNATAVKNKKRLQANAPGSAVLIANIQQLNIECKLA